MGSRHPVVAPPASRLWPAMPASRQPGKAANGTASSVGPRALEWYDWPPDAGPRLHDAGDTLQLNGVPPSAAALHACSVVVIGLGAVGAILFRQLVRAGVGTVIGVDPDNYGAESWVTQPIPRGVATGQAKARVQGEIAHATNPAVHVITARGLAQHVPLWVYRQADLLLIAADNLEVLLWAGTRAAALSKPLIQGAVHGPSWLAYVRSFALTDVNHACPACGLGQRQWAMLRSRVGCDPSQVRQQGIEPTRTVPCVCGAAANLLGGEALKHLFRIEEQKLAGEELAYCLLSHKTWRTRLDRNPDCRCPHTRWNLVDVAAPSADVTLGMLVAQGQATAPQIQGELPWLSFTVCPHCNRNSIPVRRFGRPGQTLNHCKCGQPLVASPIGTRSVLPSDDFQHCRDLPLSHLGLEPGAAVGISVDDQWTCFFVGTPELITVSRPSQHGASRSSGGTHRGLSGAAPPRTAPGGAPVTFGQPTP